MLNCVYHVLGDMQVVDNEERDRLLASGVWFGHPNEALAEKERYERKILNETEHREPQTKTENRNHEKRRQK